MEIVKTTTSYSSHQKGYGIINEDGDLLRVRHFLHNDQEVVSFTTDKDYPEFIVSKARMADYVLKTRISHWQSRDDHPWHNNVDTSHCKVVEVQKRIEWTVLEPIEIKALEIVQAIGTREGMEDPLDPNARLNRYCVAKGSGVIEVGEQYYRNGAIEEVIKLEETPPFWNAQGEGEFTSFIGKFVDYINL